MNATTTSNVELCKERALKRRLDSVKSNWIQNSSTDSRMETVLVKNSTFACAHEMVKEPTDWMVSTTVVTEVVIVEAPVAMHSA